MVRQGSKKAQPGRQSPTKNIGKIGSLKKFPDNDYSLDLLHQLARMVAPIIHERGFKVGILCEMYPKSANLLGLNVNKGQKILLRLRQPSNDRLFLPMGDLLGTLLHELTHNLYGPHDKKFYEYLDGMKKRYEELAYGGAGVASGYIMEENKLGSGGGLPSQFGVYKTMRERRLAAVTKPTYKSERRKLGTLKKEKIEKTTGTVIGDIDVKLKLIKELMLEAVERRMRDEKTCGKETEVVEISDDELYMDDSKELGGDGYKEVVDLTGDEYDEPRVEVIDISACEDDPKSILKKSRKMKKENSGERLVSFGLLPALEERGFEVNMPKVGSKEIKISELESVDWSPKIGEIHYVTSTSPRTFIQENTKYPRRKMVADLNFHQIMEFLTSLNSIPFEEIREDSLKDDHKKLQDKEKEQEQNNIVSIPIENEVAKKSVGGNSGVKSSTGQTVASKKTKASTSNGKRAAKKKVSNSKVQRSGKRTSKTKVVEVEEIPRQKKIVRTIEFSDFL